MAEERTRACRDPGPLAAAQAPTDQEPRSVDLRKVGRTWVEQRNLKPRTRHHCTSLLENHIIPTFGDVPLAHISPDAVKTWHALMGPGRPALRAHAYGLLRTILTEAERDELITRNPCHIRGAGNSKRVHKIKPASLEELEALVTAMPDRLKVISLLAAWCGLRFGELAELRRRDVDTKAGVQHIRRAVTRAAGETICRYTQERRRHPRRMALCAHVSRA